MTTRNRHVTTHWTLSDLVDFEALLASGRGATVDTVERRDFLRDIRPRLVSIADAGERRRVGLRLWLEQRLRAEPTSAGQLFGQALDVAGWAAVILLAFIGMGLVTGLLLGAGQATHVVIFFGLTLVLPWLVFLGGMLAFQLGPVRQRLSAIARMLLRLVDRKRRQNYGQQAVLDALAESRITRRVLSAVCAGLTQKGAVGFNVGAILAFIGCLLLFNVRFYWAATPEAGMDAVLAAASQAIAIPWSWIWPEAVPDMADIVSSRLIPGAIPSLGDGSWWRFLLMSLLVWGLLPRLILVALFHYHARRSLARLEFQAPRHRALWRALSAVERGEVAAGPVDGVLVLDVGGHGISGAEIRGFLLRRLRVNPLQTLPVAVLDEQRETQTQQALAAGPAGVIMLADSRMLSPRQIETLHSRLRQLLGPVVQMTWLLLAVVDGQPAAPERDDVQRWMRIVDGLRDPAMEVVGYDG